jgi:hypothetical protein
MSSIGSMVVVASLLSATGAGYNTQDAVKRNVSVDQVLRVLKIGTLPEREAVLADVLALDAAGKSVEILAAVAGELSRVNSVVHAREAAWVKGERGPVEEGYLGNYHFLLVSVASRSENPIVIQPLLGVIDTGAMATDALARFGSRAFPFVAAIARNHADEMHVCGALRTLEKMLTTGVLSPAERAEVCRVASARMEGTQPTVVWLTAIPLSLATGDQRLRTIVERIAGGTLMVSTSDDRDTHEGVRSEAQRALGRIVK